MGITNLNRLQSMVEILENEHEKAKGVLFDFVKYALFTGILNALLVPIALVFLNATVHACIHFFAIILIFRYVIRSTIKKTNLSQVGGIVFDNAAFQNHSNSEEVYQATREICEMIGFVKGQRRNINLIHLTSAVMVIAEVIEYFIEYFGIY